MRIALVHDWLCTNAGAERVLEQILSIYPHADIYAVVDFLKGSDRDWLGGREVRTTFIQKLPLARQKFRLYLPLMPFAVEQLDLSHYDVVISSSHAVAKGVLTHAEQLHVSYVHTPMRYAWDMHHEYLGRRLITSSPTSILARSMMHYIRFWDQATANRVDTFVANSHFVARRVRKTYRRDVEVIYPPVDVDSFTVHDLKEDYYLAASRLVPYKRIDLIVDAFNRRPGRRLVVIGDGPELARISAKAGPNVTLMGYQPQPVLCDFMRRARGFVFAAQEDFGITVVEAQACGTPVICFGKGGATESVIDGTTGTFFAEQTAESLNAALDRFEGQEPLLDPQAIRENAERFGAHHFRVEFKALVEKSWDRHFLAKAIPSRPSARRGAAYQSSPA